MNAILKDINGQLELSGQGVARAALGYLRFNLAIHILQIAEGDYPGDTTLDQCNKLLNEMDERLMDWRFGDGDSPEDQAFIDSVCDRLYRECNWECQGGRTTWVEWEAWPIG